MEYNKDLQPEEIQKLINKTHSISEDHYNINCAISNRPLVVKTVIISSYGQCYLCSQYVSEEHLVFHGSKAGWPIIYEGAYCTKCKEDQSKHPPMESQWK